MLDCEDRAYKGYLESALWVKPLWSAISIDVYSNLKAYHKYKINTYPLIFVDNFLY